MLWRVDFYTTFFALHVSVLLILPGFRCEDTTNFQGPHVRFVPRSEGADVSDMQSLSTNLYDGPRTIYELLKQERTNIKQDLWNLNHLLPGKKLQDLVMELGGQPHRTLIVSTWESGSTFLGEILNAVPGNLLYNYEPLSQYGQVQIRGAPHSTTAVSDMKNMFKCKFHGMDDYFEFARDNLWVFEKNTRLWNHCEYRYMSQRELCFDDRFMEKFCRLFPFQAMKVVRLRLNLVQEIITDKELNIKVVLLIRDPRGVMRARQTRESCPRSPDCSSPELLCADMISDYIAAAKFLKDHPQRLMVLRYEELALNPKETAHQIFKFLGLGMIPQVKEFLRNQTTNQMPGSISTYRISQMAFKWKRTLNFTRVHRIQLACKQAMNLWGYQIADNASHMASNNFNPLQNYFVRV